jgi:hypothetical protein
MLARVVSLATFILLAACASAPDVQTTLDPQADAGKYRTFTFVQSDPSATGAITDKLALNRLQRMIAGHLASRGYVPAEAGQSADLGVHFAGHVEPKQRVFMGDSGFYNYNWSRGYNTVDYRQGTLFVDLFNLRDKQLVWRTRISEALTTGYSEDNWKKVDRSLAEAFKSLPARR